MENETKDTNELLQEIFTVSNERYAAFHRVDAMKQQRILDAALTEFAANDYAQVSTNVIVKQAGISKGLLFHYFGDKAGLFAYLLAHVGQSFVTTVISDVDFNEKDLFALLHQAVLTKIEMSAKYRKEVQFYLRALKGNLPEEAAKFANGSMQLGNEMLELLGNNLDMSLLKDGLDREKVICSINWICQGLANEMLDNMPIEFTDEYNEWVHITQEYFDFMKSLFYK